MVKFHKATPPAPKILHLIHWILSQFQAPIWKKNCKRDPCPSWGCASKTWSFSSTCKNLGMQHPLRAEIWFLEKIDLGRYNYTSRSPKFLDQCSPDFFAKRGRNRCKSHTYPILNIFICSEDIHRRILKLGQILHVFGPENFLGVNYLKFKTNIIKFSLVLITVQNFTPIGWHISEISWLK